MKMNFINLLLTSDKEFDKLIKYIIKAKIQPPDYSDDLANALAPQQGHPSSSTWILEHPKLIEWLDGNTDRLWIHGKPGCENLSLLP